MRGTGLLIRDANNRVEHGGVKVVAVNDPFIEPKYAVSGSINSSQNLKPPCGTPTGVLDEQRR
jgi:hypothetical protein